jgi:hypothetical protein
MKNKQNKEGNKKSEDNKHINIKCSFQEYLSNTEQVQIKAGLMV